MNYSIDNLYSFRDAEGNKVIRYLVSFINEDNNLKSVEFDLIDDEQQTINIIYEESDSLSEDDRCLLMYILDRWSISNLI